MFRIEKLLPYYYNEKANEKIKNYYHGEVCATDTHNKDNFGSLGEPKHIEMGAAVVSSNY